MNLDATILRFMPCTSLPPGYGSLYPPTSGCGRTPDLDLIWACPHDFAAPAAPSTGFRIMHD